MNMRNVLELEGSDVCTTILISENTEILAAHFKRTNESCLS